MELALIQAPAWGRDCPPYTMCFLAALLRQKGHRAHLFDLNNALYHTSPASLKKMWDDKDYYSYWEDPETVRHLLSSNRKIVDYYIERILGTPSRIIGFTVHFSSGWASLALAEEIKKRDSGRIVVFGGPDCSRQLKGDYYVTQPCVDVVVQGEGEQPLFDIIRSAGRLPEKRQLAGCLLLREGRIVDGGIIPGPRNLDSLPAPDYSDFRDEISLRLYRQPHRLDISDSRGCITGCHFCSEWQFWGRFRSKSGRKIFQEIQQHLRDFPQVNYFYFIGSLVNGDMDALDTLCSQLIAHRLKIQWAAQAVVRPEMDEQFLKKLRRSGCTWLSYGIESGSERVLCKMNKKFSLGLASRVLEATKKAGIEVQANFMFGLPTETREDFEQTLEFLKNNRKNIDTILASQSFCVIDKGTYLHAHPGEFGITNRNHHLYWESNEGENNYVERNRRYEEFCRLALSLGIPETSGVLKNKPDKWRLLGDYYLYKRDYASALGHYEQAERFEARTPSLSEKLATCYEEAGAFDKAGEALSRGLEAKGALGAIPLVEKRLLDRLAAVKKTAEDIRAFEAGRAKEQIGDFAALESARLNRILRYFAQRLYRDVDLEWVISGLHFNEKQKSMSRALYSHGFWQKLSNYILIETQKARKEPLVYGYPYWLVIDPCNICNLHCPFCPTGQGRNVRTKGTLGIEEFKRIMDKLGPYAVHLDLVNWGEPFLNRHIYEMVRYAKGFGCDTKIDTNLSFLSDEDAESLVCSGLDKIVVSIDGLSPATYGTYRRGGDFDKVMENLNRLIKTRRALKRTHPYITWQFLVFRHNEHEINDVLKVGKRLGVDHVGITKAFIGDKDWMPSDPAYSNYEASAIEDKEPTSRHFKEPQDAFCSWPWEAVAINTNCSVSSCCSVEEEADDFGNFFDQPFEELWNGPQYQAARRYIRDKDPKVSVVRNICIGCRHLGLINVDILSCHSFF